MVRFKLVCDTCGKALTGKQERFCCRRCKQRYHGASIGNSAAQYQRGLQRKLHLLNLKGGKCSVCGYNKNIAALCFHHIDRSIKTKKLDMRVLSNNSLEAILKEAENCILICSNCHIELHNPRYDNLLK